VGALFSLVVVAGMKIYDRSLRGAALEAGGRNAAVQHDENELTDLC
jgi:hypothetical protein